MSILRARETAGGITILILGGDIRKSKVGGVAVRIQGKRGPLIATGVVLYKTNTGQLAISDIEPAPHGSRVLIANGAKDNGLRVDEFVTAIDEIVNNMNLGSFLF